MPPRPKRVPVMPKTTMDLRIRRDYLPERIRDFWYAAGAAARSRA